MKDQLKKRVLAKRIAKRITFVICDGLSIELNSYALLRPAIPGTITWLDSTTNLPVKVIWQICSTYIESMFLHSFVVFLFKSITIYKWTPLALDHFFCSFLMNQEFSLNVW